MPDRTREPWSRSVTCADLPDKRLKLLHFSDEEPVSVRLTDNSTLVVEAAQVEHVVQRSVEGRKRAPFERSPFFDISAIGDPLEGLVRGRQLRYVLRRGVLGPHPSFLYVFAAEVGGIPATMLAVASKRRDARISATASAPHSRDCCAESLVDRECPQCRQRHYRCLITVMHEVNGVKQKFLAGLEKYDGRTFDPAEHCEWFSELPETWQVSVAGRDVVMRSALHGTTSFESPALVQLLERERATDFVPFSRLRLRSNALATKLASAYQVARCSGADWG